MAFLFRILSSTWVPPLEKIEPIPIVPYQEAIAVHMSDLKEFPEPRNVFRCDSLIPIQRQNPWLAGKFHINISSL
jgi:hypothetical protein